ncbi:hypothetical protein [Ruminococcus albus]|uniref:Uncharacterized protein n=1 Tax=Ruminococcus albus TaxID=1264 RepID=A0A1H7KC21_RUMAL|nr:hypothetical protein [Ruminococcus albus]SEK84403.1 hypothetical protein SAMN05216469_106161 [Ruminococcus albus]
MAIHTFRELLEKSEGAEYVIHVQSEEELEELVTALEALEYEFCLPFLGTIREKAAEFSSEDGADGCWRISRERGVAYNPSVEHWRFFSNNIVEMRDGSIAYNDGDYDDRAAAVEKEKLRYAFFEDEDKDNARKLFGFENAADADIQKWLDEKFPEK